MSRRNTDPDVIYIDGEEYVTAEGAERRTGFPAEVLEALSGEFPRPHGSRADRSERRRLVLKFWGSVRGINPFAAPTGCQPRKLLLDIEASHGRGRDGGTRADAGPKPSEKDVLAQTAAWTYVQLALRDRLLKWGNIAYVIQADIDAGSPKVPAAH